jgi:hypothetical protein
MFYFILIFSLLSLFKQSYATNTAYNRVTGLNLTSYWMEIGYTSVDDSAFVSVSTYATSFTSPVVFVSAPVYGTSLYTGGYPLAPRVKNIAISDGAISFEFKVSYLNSVILFVILLLILSAFYLIFIHSCF